MRKFQPKDKVLIFFYFNESLNQIIYKKVPQWN